MQTLFRVDPMDFKFVKFQIRKKMYFFYNWIINEFILMNSSYFHVADPANFVLSYKLFLGYKNCVSNGCLWQQSKQN